MLKSFWNQKGPALETIKRKSTSGNLTRSIAALALAPLCASALAPLCASALAPLCTSALAPLYADALAPLYADALAPLYASALVPLYVVRPLPPAAAPEALREPPHRCLSGAALHASDAVVPPPWKRPRRSVRRSSQP